MEAQSFTGSEALLVRRRAGGPGEQPASPRSSGARPDRAACAGTPRSAMTPAGFELERFERLPATETSSLLRIAGRLPASLAPSELAELQTRIAQARQTLGAAEPQPPGQRESSSD